jgi:hypothetical protein
MKGNKKHEIEQSWVYSYKSICLGGKMYMEDWAIAAKVIPQ